MSTPAAIISTRYDTQVAGAIAELAAASFSGGLRAVLLTGSLARGEGTWFREGSRVRLAGDADCFAVFHDRAPLPSPGCVARLLRLAENRLASAWIEAHLGLSPVRCDYLRRLQRNIFSYELTTQGKVVWGDADILKHAPAFTAQEIPLDDGFRMLMNRIIELLEAVCTSDGLPARVSAVRYRAMKLWLDMGTSFLLFKRHYAPTYRGRAVNLCELAADPCTLAPIPLQRFARAVALATRCKVGESEGLELQQFTDLATLIGDAQSLWRWELEGLTFPGASDYDLILRWTAAEPIAARLRGWAAVIKRAGANRTIARMPHWLALAREGSPRRLIYAAASELFFALPRLLGNDLRSAADSHWDEFRHKLPITDSPRDWSPCCPWRRLGGAIAFNYNFLLAPTRS